MAFQRRVLKNPMVFEKRVPKNHMIIQEIGMTDGEEGWCDDSF